MPEVNVDVEVREKSRRARQKEFEKMIEGRFYEAIGSALSTQRKKWVKLSAICLVVGLAIGVIVGIRF